MQDHIRLAKVHSNSKKYDSFPLPHPLFKQLIASFRTSPTLYAPESIPYYSSVFRFF